MTMELLKLSDRWRGTADNLRSWGEMNAAVVLERVASELDVLLGPTGRPLEWGDGVEPGPVARETPRHKVMRGAAVKVGENWYEMGRDAFWRFVVRYYRAQGVGSGFESTVYFIQDPVSKRVKIGRAGDVEKRARSIQACSPVPLVLAGTVLGGQWVEETLHALLDKYRLHGEWFEWSPELERFLA